MKRSLRIVMIVFNQTGKGTYWRAFHAARGLVERNHHVTLICMSRQSHWQLNTFFQNGVCIVETPDMLWGPLRSGWDLWESWRRILWLRQHHFDLVHAFECRPTVLFPAWYMHSFRKAALIIDWCDWFGRGGSVEERPNALLRTILRPIETFFEEYYRPYADGATVICTTLQQKAIALGVEPKRILFWRDGADVTGLQPLDKKECRQALNLPVNAPLIGYLGAIFYRDGQLMAKAFDQVQAVQAEARLLLIGYVNVPVEEMVVNKTAVIRTGYIDYADVNRYLAACDVCWLPYHDSNANRGRYPMKLNDYMATARPTVATAVGDVTTIMQTHDVGLLSQPTAEDIAEKTLILLADPTRCLQQGHYARHIAEEEFDWELRTEELEAFYYKILSGKKNDRNP